MALKLSGSQFRDLAAGDNSNSSSRVKALDLPAANLRRSAAPAARATGGAPMSPEIARRVVELFRRYTPPPHADYRLTPQESELLRLLVAGYLKRTAAR